MLKKLATAGTTALSVAAVVVMLTAPAEARNGRKGALIGGIAAGLLGAAIIGSHARNRRHYEEPEYRDCWIEKRARYNRYGEFRGYRRIRVCN